MTRLTVKRLGGSVIILSGVTSWAVADNGALIVKTGHSTAVYAPGQWVSFYEQDQT